MLFETYVTQHMWTINLTTRFLRYELSEILKLYKEDNASRIYKDFQRKD